jgi:hypothetical protein
VLLVAAVIAVLMGGLLVIGWQSLPGGDLYSAAIAAFEVSLDVWGPAALGGALGFATVPIVRHLEEQYGKRLGAQVLPRDVNLTPPDHLIEDSGQLTGNGRALHGNGAAKQKARRTAGRTSAVLTQQTDSPDRRTYGRTV